MFSAFPSKTMPFSAAALAVVLLVASAAGAAEQAAVKSLPPRTAQAWTFEQAVQQMGLYPDDVYLQYVVLQLARNEGKGSAGTSAIEGLNPRWGRRNDRTVDLFALMTDRKSVV